MESCKLLTTWVDSSLRCPTGAELNPLSDFQQLCWLLKLLNEKLGAANAQARNTAPIRKDLWNGSQVYYYKSRWQFSPWERVPAGIYPLRTGDGEEICPMGIAGRVPDRLAGRGWGQICPVESPWIPGTPLVSQIEHPIYKKKHLVPLTPVTHPHFSLTPAALYSYPQIT
jgi:hypothetical protein